MPSYLIEGSLPRSRASELADAADRLRRAAAPRDRARGGGAQTKQVAAALFVSPKTVEGHLTNIYAKLGVHSRTELARRMRDDEA